MTSDNIRQRVFRRLLARETGQDADAPAIAAACRRLCERLAQLLTPLIGVAGVAAICARSVRLARQRFPGLATANAPNQPDAPPFALLQQSLEQQEPTAATEAAVAVLASAADSLALFIGESLTMRVLCEAWPDDFDGNVTDDETSEETST